LGRFAEARLVQTARLAMSKILLVDDSPDVRALVADALRRPQRAIITAAHGEQALELVACGTPDLVITDIVMPRMNGWELVRRLRTTPATALVPVIFMTALTAKTDRIRGFRIGADDYITKPVDIDELVLRVQKVLHHARRARETLRSAGLAGDLSQFGLATTLTILELERKTGLLTVEGPDERAELIVKNGRVVSAKLTGRDDRVGLDCVCEIVTWASGRWSFAERPVDTSDDLQMTTMAILMEAARKLDELIPVDLD
jgi:CheY-like chemotaxis protein